MADLKERIIIDAVDNTTRGFKSAQRKVNLFERAINRVGTTIAGFVGISIFSGMIGDLTRASDTALDLEAKLKLVTESTKEFEQASTGLLKISQDTGTSLEANTVLFTRLNRAVKNNGGVTTDTLKITEALANSLRISGASAQESASVIRQFSQAQQSGLLRGEEFNAIMENGGRLAFALADGIGVSIGALRAMSKDGKLTTDVVNKAILSQSELLKKEIAGLPITIGRSVQQVQNAFIEMLKGAGEANGAIASFISTIAKNLNTIVNTLLTVGTVFATVFAVKGGVVLLGFLNAFKLKLFDLSVSTSKIGVEWLKVNGIVKSSLLSQIKDTTTLTTLERVKADAQKVALLEKAKEGELIAQISAIKGKDAVKDQQSAIQKRQAQIINLQALAEEKVALANIAVQKARQRSVDRQASLQIAVEAERVKRSLFQETVARKQLLVTDIQKLKSIAKVQQAEINNSITFLGNSAKKRQAQEALAVTEGKLLIAEQALTTTSKQQTVVTKALDSAVIKLTASKVSLGVAEGKLTTALLAETTALTANTRANLSNATATFASGRSVAQGSSFFTQASNRASRATASTTGFFSKLTTGFRTVGSVAVKFLGRIGSALFGIPGLIALVVYEFLSFFDLLPNFTILGQAFRRGFGVITDTLGTITGGFIGTVNAVKRADEAFDKSLVDAQLREQGFKSLADKQRARQAEAIKKLGELELKKASIQKDLLDRTKELNTRIDADNQRVFESQRKRLEDDFIAFKSNLNEKTLSRQDYNDQVTAFQITLNEELNALGKDATKQDIIELDARLVKFKSNLNEKLVELDANNIALLGKEKDLQQSKLDLEIQFNDQQIVQAGVAFEEKRRLLVDSGQSTVDATREFNLQIREINSKTADLLRSEIKQLAQDEIDAVQKRKNIISSFQDFERSIFGDRRTSRQKDADDRKSINEINDKLRKASQLDEVKDADQIAKLRQSALDDGKELVRDIKSRASSAKKGSLEQITAENLLKQAFDVTKNASKGLADITKQVGINAKNAGIQRTIQLQEYLSEIKKLDAVIAIQREIEVKLNKQKLFDDIDIIDQSIKKLNQIVTVTVVENRVSSPQQKASGGFIHRENRVPGSGNGDTVKALLTPGEFIVKKSAVANVGSGFLNALNSGNVAPQKFAQGGIVQKFAQGGNVLKVGSERYRSQLLNTLLDSILDKKANGKQYEGKPLLGGSIQSLSAVFSSRIADKILEALKGLRSSPIGDVVKFSDNIKKLINEYFGNPVRWSGNSITGSVGRRRSAIEADINALTSKASFKRFADGGSVGGTGLGDTVKALLTPGEFVMKKSVVQRFGSQFFSNINQGVAPQKFANGGLVGGNSKATGSSETIDVNFNISGQQATGTFMKDNITAEFINSLRLAGATT